jgi:hypothetical protein
MNDLLGTRISHYRIIDFLSKGGMGDVKVLEFGLSRSRQDENTLKLIANALGTLRSLRAERSRVRKPGQRNKSRNSLSTSSGFRIQTKPRRGR